MKRKWREAASHRLDVAAWFSRNRLLDDTEPRPMRIAWGARELVKLRENLRLISALRYWNLVVAIQAVASFQVSELDQWQ